MRPIPVAMSVLLKKFYNIFDYNPSTLSGCLDVIVVQKKDGSCASTPFHVRVGKLKAFSTKLKKLQVFVNGVDTKQTMYLNAQGIGYFETEVGSGSTADTDNDASSAFFQSDEETSETPGPLPKESGSPELGPSVKDKDRDSPELEGLHRSQTGPENLELSGVHSKSAKASRKMSDYKAKDDFEVLNRNSQTPALSPTDPGETAEESVQLSLCGHLLTDGLTPDEIDSIFQQHLVPFARFDSQAVEILRNERLMIRIGSRIYDSYFGLPQLVARSVYGSGLSDLAMSNMKDRLAKLPLEKTGSEEHPRKSPPRTVKSLKPPSSFWSRLQLKDGLNVLQYKFRGNLDADYVLEARIFYYPFGPQYRLVVSDIDGTITKSDILGHIMPFIYRDWSHTGLAELYNNLVRNGYQVVYLTARNIGQATKTLNYLKSVRQKGFSLPDGPLITAPDTLYESLKREVIIRNPEVFKIRVLRQLKKLFGGSADFNPLFGGFGNKDTDAIAYAVVGISKKRIFTINPDGDIFLLKSGVVTSYDELNRRVDALFPPQRPDGVNSEESDSVSRENACERLADAG